MNTQSNQLITIRPRFIEATYKPNQRTADVHIISSGHGNSKDGNWYPPETIQDAVDRGVFEGVPAFLDHSSPSEQRDRPERSVKDMVGHYFGSHVARATDPKTGKPTIAYAAKLKVREGAAGDEALALIRHAVDYQTRFPGQDFGGLSVDADGHTESGVDDDGNPANVVKRITKANSADLVTYPARGGRFLALTESERIAQSAQLDSRTVALLKGVLGDDEHYHSVRESGDPTRALLAGVIPDEHEPQIANFPPMSDDNADDAEPDDDDVEDRTRQLLDGIVDDLIDYQAFTKAYPEYRNAMLLRGLTGDDNE